MNQNEIEAARCDYSEASYPDCDEGRKACDRDAHVLARAYIAERPRVAALEIVARDALAAAVSDEVFDRDIDAWSGVDSGDHLADIWNDTQREPARIISDRIAIIQRLSELTGGFVRYDGSDDDFVWCSFEELNQILATDSVDDLSEGVPNHE